ncbi:MAG: DUF2130 domain-containing protein [Candidatus Scalindua sp.]|nr:DUF2130 domain-containing protein [Candidatus Scalindua sp.]
MTETIKCPSCGDSFELTEVISQDIENKFKKEHTHEIEEVKNALKLEYEAKEEEFENKAKQEKKVLQEKAKNDALGSVEIEISDMKEQLKENADDLKMFRSQEIGFRKKERELLKEKESMDLVVDRKLDQERQKVLEEAAGKFEEKQRLKDVEKDKRINDMVAQINDLKRKSEQGSQQTQGEVLELELENILRTCFIHDHIEPVPKGIKGADVLQKVHNPSGQYCGTIVWETKRTKAWSDGWISKLKEDQRMIKGEVAIILTTTMPKDVKGFAHINGVWVTDYASMVGIATAIRMGLIEVANTKLAEVGKKGKMEVVYNYLSGAEFKHKVEAIVEAFKGMKDDLEKEKKAFTKIWAKREKQIELVVSNTASMYGDIHGIIGASLPQIKLLEIESEEEADGLL